MPIHRLLEKSTFQPATAALFGHVFEEVLKEFGLVRRKDPLTELIAEKLIELANAGERDPIRLKQLTIAAARGNGTTSA